MKLPRLQFRLRTLFLVVTLLALPLGWFSHKLRQAERQRDAVAKLRAMNSGNEYTVCYDWEWSPDNDYRLPWTQEPEPTWCRRALGDDFFDRVVAVQGEGISNDSEGLRSAAGLPDLEVLRLANHMNIDDRNVVPLAALRRLRRLDLSYTNVGNDGLACLSQMTELEELNLPGTQVTGDGLVHLQSLTKLKKLDLEFTKISGDRLKCLNALTNLEWLDLSETDIRADDLANLRLPKLQQLLVRGFGLDPESPTAAISPRLFDGLPNLQSFLVWQSAVQPAQPGWMAAILRLSNLTELDLRCVDIADDDLERIDQLRHLHSLVLLETKITDAGLRSLARLPELAEVTSMLPEGRTVYKRGFETLQRARPKLHIQYPSNGFTQFHLPDDVPPSP